MVMMHEVETTFAQALRNKYVEQEVFDDELVLPKDHSISTDITFVGFGKVSSIQQQLRRLTSIDLSDKNIRHVGDLSNLRGSLNNIRTLNLANNSMSWQSCIDILHCFPNLKELILTKNHLVVQDDSIFIDQNRTRKGLSCLSLGRVNLSWTEIVRILSHIWNNVEQLDLWDNNLNSEKMKGSHTVETNEFVANIKSLHLSHNRFVDISWIENVGQLEKLVELDLSNCHIEKINITPIVADQLKNLMTLNISYNNIADWQSISNLYYLVKLQNLLCIDNPLFITDKLVKPLTIGRLGGLKMLNREEITPGQRRDSEIFYLRRTFPDYQSSLSSTNNTFKLSHPRYNELVQIYGIPDDLNKSQVVDKYLTVDLSYKDKKLTKRLPCDMRISNLKMLCKRVFNLQPSTVITLTCYDSDPEKCALKYELDKDGQTLHYFSVKSGHTLLLEERDR